MGAGKQTRRAVPEAEGFGNPAASKRQAGSSKVTVSSGRSPSPAFSLSFPVWSKASRTEKALGWELPSLIPIHSTFQREWAWRRAPVFQQCSWHSLLRTLEVLHTAQLPELGTVSTGGARFGNQNKETKTSDKFLLIISGIQDVFRTGSQEKLVFK